MASWLPIPSKSHFSLANIPFGIISTSSQPTHRPAIAIDQYVLDLSAFAQNNGFSKFQLRNTIHTLQARVNEQQNAAPANTGEPRGRDIREALKPPKPEPFTGKAADVILFLTRMKAHFRLFLNRLDTATKKVLYTSLLIQGDAKD
ncbi:Fumarylacetoacetase, N-terminal domain superfamily [Fusarium oxysporum f. sp. vasinfectum]|nr:Fumarylacetoacetase, N-terminal domain superfamily [Fusarium oxysporum f. sp. vasinfectum]